MSLKNIFAYWIGSLTQFLRLPVSNTKRIEIFTTFFRVTIIFLFYVRLFRRHRTHERIFGFQVHAFEYETIFFLLAEIFYRGEYAFISVANEPHIIDCGANI